jgi:hypothetical protein
MGPSDHTRVGWPKRPSEGERAGHRIVGQDRHQMMRRFTGCWDNPGPVSRVHAMASRPISLGNRSAQNPANRGAADLQATGDFGFADTGQMQFPNLRGVEPRGDGPAQALAVQPCLG